MKNQTILLAISLIAIGVFVMPSTVSLFTGQHTFYNGSDVQCRKCHEDIYEEMHSSENSVHWNVPGPKGQYDVFSCRECHNVTNVSTYFQTGSSMRSEAHAATTVPCLACHSGLKGYTGSRQACDSCHERFNPKAPGPYQFPMHALAFKYKKGHNPNQCGQCHLDAENPTADNAFIELINRSITGSEAAHSEYFYQASYPDNQSEIKLKDSNAACIGCHTHTTINITWKRNVGYDMIINHSSGDYNITYVKNSTMTTTYSGGE